MVLPLRGAMVAALRVGAMIVPLRGAMVVPLRGAMDPFGEGDIFSGSKMMVRVTTNVPSMVLLDVPLLPDVTVPFLADGVRVLFRLGVGATAVPFAVGPTAVLRPTALVSLDEVVVPNVLLPTAEVEVAGNPLDWCKVRPLVATPVYTQ